jgi:hypothetical protein
MVFAAGRPSLRELLAVRAIVPRFADAPMSSLKAEVGMLNEFAVEDLSGREAHRLQSVAHKRGLQTRIEGTSFTEYLPVSIHSAALLIEDDELSILVAEEMRRRGVPVVNVECD